MRETSNVEREIRMKSYDEKRNKHLTQEDRNEIQLCLDRGMPFKTIGSRIKKAATTVSREVFNRRIVKESSVKWLDNNGNPVEGRECPRLRKAPFVCNGCDNRRRCAFVQKFYYSVRAHHEYRDILVESREGTPLNKQEFYESNDIITNGIKNGQRLYHIMESNDISFSKSTAYRHLKKGYLGISPIDMPRAVKFKARKSYKAPGVPKTAKRGREYADFLAYIAELENKQWVEMDTVIGRVGGKVIMTFHFTINNFMFGLLLDNKSAPAAATQIIAFKKRLIKKEIRFGTIIPLLLTDNGGEFANVSAFTDTLDGETESMLFFCDPYRSCQKPKIEKNHTIFRDIVPKGTSFDNFTQQDVNLIFSHVNGVKRKIFNGKSPYYLFIHFFSQNIAEALGITEIQPHDVIQSPALLRKLKK
jgi:IS30 family transposase